MEQSSTGYAQLQDEVKQLKEKSLLEGQSRDAFFNELVKKSNQVKTKVHKACDGKQKSQD